jgi:3-oxoacyl-[acyl-carrier protein] reductase
MKDPLDFSGKNVLVVGGTSGIGNGIAHAFLDHGATVGVWGTRASASDYRADEGCDLAGLRFSHVDVSKPEQVSAWQPDFDELDVLVLAQGIVKYRRAEFEDDGFRDVVNVNLNSVMSCCNRFRQSLKRTSGSVIVISSLVAYRSAIANPAYTASKAAAVALTETLGAAWASEGIRVNGIAPGLVETKLTEVMTKVPQRLETALKSIPAGRLGLPSDMADVALFLASTLARYVVGHTIPVDGGMRI